jgi:hypothetical protein
MTADNIHSNAVAMREAIEIVEEAYEYMLAYAAQGKKQETDEGGVSKIRQYLTRFCEALDALEQAAASEVFTEGGEEFGQRFLNELKTTRSALMLVMARPAITSDMVDNTNALLAVRAFLTNLFFIDQVVLPAR